MQFSHAIFIRFCIFMQFSHVFCHIVLHLFQVHQLLPEAQDRGERMAEVGQDSGGQGSLHPTVPGQRGDHPGSGQD